MTKNINSEEFKTSVLESRGYTFVDFYADWCGPCSMLSPIMEEVEKEYSVYRVNVDEEADLAREYSVMSIPCVVLFQDGKEITRSIGLKTKEEILKMINS